MFVGHIKFYVNNCVRTYTYYIYIYHLYFPTCQVRVVRFYHSCSPPPSPPPHPPPPSPPPPSPPASPPPPLHPLPCSLPPCQRFAKLFANFRTQWALLDLNCKGLTALGTAESSTWDLPSSVSTAGPQPGTRLTSTWDPPSSVSTAGPQPGTLRAQ